MIAKLSALPLWGNARDIIALAKSIVGVVYSRSGSREQI